MGRSKATDQCTARPRLHSVRQSSPEVRGAHSCRVLRRALLLQPLKFTRTTSCQFINGREPDSGLGLGRCLVAFRCCFGRVVEASLSLPRSLLTLIVLEAADSAGLLHLSALLLARLASRVVISLIDVVDVGPARSHQVGLCETERQNRRRFKVQARLCVLPDFSLPGRTQSPSSC